MNPFEFVIVIIVVSFGYKLLRTWLCNRPRESADEPARSALLKKLEEVEERVRVLERIVTDGGYDLAHKIEALRDERGVDARVETSAPRGRV